MRHRQPSILDVVTAVKRIAEAYPDVAAWWYAPAKRLRLAGDRPEEPRALVEVAVETSDPGLDCERIARELSRALGDVPCHVRAYRGAQEDRRLYRLVSSEPPASARGE